MLLGVLIGRKTYTMYKYFFVLLIVLGVILFSYKDKYEQKDGEDPILGIIFIGLSLLFDGLLGAFEDRMRSVKKPTPLNLMVFLNAWNSLYLAIAIAFNGEAVTFFNFCMRHPIVMRDMSVIVVCGIFGQFCLTSMVANFGALPSSITTTIRKCITVFLSVLIFQNELSVRQWIATGIIFGALFLDGYFSKRPKKGDKKMKNGKEGVDNPQSVKVEDKTEQTVVPEVVSNKTDDTKL
jgi:solute carrier family 35 (UDP-galactose transporter), member B1